MYKEPFKTGMIFRSKTHPQFDLIIDYVSYYRCSENTYDFNLFSIICWSNINREEFTKFVEQKLGKDYGSTFPYVYAGECKISSMKQRLKKYNLEFVGMTDEDILVYTDNSMEYSSGFKNMHSKLSD